MNVAIIVAAGRGTRAGGEEPKQFRALAVIPLLIHTLRRFEACAIIDEIVLVAPVVETTRVLSAVGSGLTKCEWVVEGGATRTESVWQGLQSLRAQDVEIVAVHDGVRPFVTPDEIERTVRAAGESGAAVLCAPVVDTIKQVGGDGRISRTLPRETLRRALTPQCFRYALLRRAHEHARAEGFDATDDSTLVEMLGAPVTAIEGDARNIKITRPEDFALAEILLKERKQ